MTSDLHLLELEIDTLWRRDERNCLVEAAPHLVLGLASEGWTLAFGSEVPDALVAEVKAVVAAAPPASNPSAGPPGFARCRELVEALLGPAELSSGPGYLIPAGTKFESPAAILRSTDADVEVAQSQDPERVNWPADEWRDLLNGTLGPWAMGVMDRRVIAICHSARLTGRGAEAGVWTAPDFRGQGHAAAVTAAWAELLVPSGRHIFYSTSADNLSSQRVASRLRLRPIGWMWKLGRPRPNG